MVDILSIVKKKHVFCDNRSADIQNEYWKCFLFQKWLHNRKDIMQIIPIQRKEVDVAFTHEWEELAKVMCFEQGVQKPKNIEPGCIWTSLRFLFCNLKANAFGKHSISHYKITQFC